MSTSETAPDDVSALLRAWTEGDQRALARLTPIVYDELHRLAHYCMKRERSSHSLQTTGLVNEAYIRLVDYKRMQWQNRAHSGGSRRGADEACPAAEPPAPRPPQFIRLLSAGSR